ncbi:MAG: VWA domain-containing protein [Akkermansiaceae bacterium]|nr:VWA domain-containing protein [Akkermansiaceae bacterium]
MSFLHPGWLLLLLILPFILLGAILAQQGRSKAWQRMVAPRLRKQLVKEGSNTRRWVSLAIGLASCALLIGSIARPYQGETTTTAQIRTRNILIAIDTSRSMLVRDTSPDRIGSAKAMALELLAAFPNDRIGVIAFSGAPVLMAPLTIDHSSVHETLSQLDTNVIPSGGSDLAAAVQLAIETFKKSGHKSNALIVISDGEDHSEQIDLAGSEIREAGIAVCTIGIGKEAGGIIPDPRQPDGKYRDIKGHTVHSRLNPGALDQLARAGRGTYVPASTGADSAIRSALSFLESDQQAGRKISIPRESYQWFLLPAIILLVISMLVRSNLFTNKLRAPSAPTIPCLVIILCLLAGENRLLAATDIEHAAAAYARKDYDAALDFFTKALPSLNGEDRRAVQFSQGSSAYRLKQWHHATRYFSQALLSNNNQLQEQSHYNLGNTLFQSGWTVLNPPKATKTPNPFIEQMRKLMSQEKATESPPGQTQLTKSDVQQVMTNWQDAITHYQAALDINPNNQEAEDNRKEVEKLLKQLQDALDQAEKESEDGNDDQQGEGKDSDNKNDKQGDGKDPKQDPDNQGKGDSNNKPETPEPGDQKNDDPGDKPDDNPQKNQPKEQPERKAGESKEAFAARILKEHADAETRPVNRRFIQLRRPVKDW